MPTLPDLSLSIPEPFGVWLAVVVCVLIAWGAYAVPQYWAIEKGWPRVYHAAPYTSTVVGGLVYLLSVKHTPTSAFLGVLVIYTFIDGHIAGPGYERGRELREQYGEDWADHWEQPEVPV